VTDVDLNAQFLWLLCSIDPASERRRCHREAGFDLGLGWPPQPASRISRPRQSVGGDPV